MIPIVFSTDHNYVMPAGVTIASLLLHRGDVNYHIYILCAPDVTSEDRDMLRNQVHALSPESKIEFVNMGDKFKNGFEVREISTACYYRLMIPWLLPEVDKIIYCDVDIIFLCSLKELYEVDLGDNLVAGSTPGKWVVMKRYFEKIGIDYHYYINSGVLVINSKLQRENGLDKEYDRLSRKKFLYQDQDIINLACKGRISYFDSRYNMMPQLYGKESRFSKDVIIHYAGDKPWKNFTYAWVQWWDVYNQSVFKDNDFYIDVSNQILSPRNQLKSLLKKVKVKFHQFNAKQGLFR